MVILLLIRGLPGAGRSTLAESIGWPTFEADTFFSGRDFDHTLLPTAHLLCQMAVRASLENGRDTIVSNTLTTDWEVAQYESIAKRVGATLFSVVAENRHGSSPTRDIPLKTIDTMERKLRGSLKLNFSANKFQKVVDRLRRIDEDT